MNDPMRKILELYRAHRQIVSYLFFGVCSAVLNILCYAAAYELLDLSNTLSTVLAWLAAVLFAFFTNKLLVFQSRRATASKRLEEFVSFFGCRLLTGALDVGIMAVAVDCLHRNGVLWKLISNGVVTVLNYIASKLFIFTDPRKK